MAVELQSPGSAHWLRTVFLGRRPKRTVVRLAVLIIVATVGLFVLVPVRITGISMEPTYHDGSFNLINRLAYCASKPHRGDVVGVRLAGQRALLLVRIVALPGESFRFADGHVCINDVPQAEPYLKLPSDWKFPGQTLGSDEYYGVGDNRSMPREDHIQGTVGKSQIVGKVVFPGNR